MCEIFKILAKIVHTTSDQPQTFNTMLKTCAIHWSKNMELSLQKTVHTVNSGKTHVYI